MTQLKFESKEQAQDFVRAYVKVGRTMSDSVINNLINHYMTSVALYRMKLTDIVWFDGEIGESSEVAVTVNPAITDEEEVSKRTKPYIGETRSYLMALCRAKEVPAWVIAMDIRNDTTE